MVHMLKFGNGSPLNWTYDYLSILRLKLIHVSKRDLWMKEWRPIISQDTRVIVQKSWQGIVSLHKFAHGYRAMYKII